MNDTFETLTGDLKNVAIFTDCDNVLTDTTKSVNKKVAEHLKITKESDPERWTMLQEESCDEIQADSKHFPNILIDMIPYYEKIFKGLKTIPGAKEFVNKARELGARVNVITARTAALISKDIESITRQNLADNGIEIDELWIEKNDKSCIGEMIKEGEFAVFIDDNIENCKRVLENCDNVNCIIFFNPRGIDEKPEGIFLAKSWDDVANIFVEQFKSAN